MLPPLPPDERALCDVSLSALRHNLAQIRRMVGPGVRICGVVKANAYGHDATQIAETLQSEGVERLAVASWSEAQTLRGAGITTPLLVFGGIPAGAGRTAATQQIEPVIWDLERARALRAELEPAYPLGVHLEVDTGMTRTGATADRAVEIARALNDAPLELRGVMSHLARADEPGHPSVADQTRRFEACLDGIREAGVPVGIRHLANSAGMLADPATHMDMVRPGIALYGGVPHPDFGPGLDLRPVMTFRARILQIREVPAGTGIGYGHRYVTDEARRIAVLAVGYGHGYPRALAGDGVVRIRGCDAPVRGTVSMDHLAVDVTAIPDAREGDPALLWGGDETERIDVMEVGRRAGTIGYELLTGMEGRLPFRFRSED